MDELTEPGPATTHEIRRMLRQGRMIEVGLAIGIVLLVWSIIESRRNHAT